MSTIAALREESRGHRDEARAAATALQQLRDDTTARFGALAAALGVTQPTEQTDTPEALVAALTDRITAGEAQARQLRMDLGIRDVAPTLGADVTALADSRAFAEATAVLDPTAPDFRARLGEAITAALAANPRLRVQADPTPTTAPAVPDPAVAPAPVPPAAGVSGAPITAGTGTTPPPGSLFDAVHQSLRG